MSYDLFPGVDENYLLPPEVRGALAASVELRNQVVPMTQTARNNLTGDELWDNRIIFNTTTDRMDRYDLASTTWIQVTTEPAGVIKEYGGDTAPDFHVMADGGVYPRTGIYAALFAVYGTKYNTGGEDGSHFRVVNKKGRAGVGFDASQTEFNALGKTSGEKTHTLTVAELASHAHGGGTGTETANHSHADGGHQHALPLADQSVQSGTGATVQKWSASPAQTSVGASAALGTESAAHGHAIGAEGGGAAHNNLQPSIALNYIITL